jgi:CRP-like cAMP-binding protein
MEQGKYFGELALSQGLSLQGKRAARVVCEEDCVFCTMDKKDFKDAIEHNLKFEILRKV